MPANAEHQESQRLRFIDTNGHDKCPCAWGEGRGEVADAIPAQNPLAPPSPARAGEGAGGSFKSRRGVAATIANSAKSPVYYAMLFERIFGPRTPPASPVVHLSVGPQPLPLLMVRNPRARRYLLRLRPDGTARVTIPRGGSTALARQFVERHAAWLERELQRLQSQPRKPAVWTIGTEILLRGEAVRIETGSSRDGARTRTIRAETVRFGSESVRVSDPAADLRPAIEGHLRQLAARELPPRVLELAARHGLTVRRITVRNQKSRWGSCSRRGTISLNWRLIQTPAFVSDYICLHELVHLRQMNHSPGFWREMERVCPDYRMAKHWLKEHSGLLR